MSNLTGLVVSFADMDFGHMGNWGAGWWIVMIVGMLLFWSLVILGGVWVVRELSGRRAHEHGELNASDLLDRRLVEGQISPEEYEERRRILSNEARTGQAGP